MKWRVRYYIDFEVEADYQDEALDVSEEMLDRTFEHGVLRISEILKSETTMLE